MGSRGLAVAAIALFAMACGPEPSPPGAGRFVAARSVPLFPLEPGTRWHYLAPHGEVHVVAERPRPDEPGQIVLVSHGAIERRDALETIGPFAFLLARGEGGTVTRFLPFALAGFTQPVEAGGEMHLRYLAVRPGGSVQIDEVWRVRSTTARVQVPAGDFDHVTELERVGSDGSWISDWAAGIGKLREVGPDGELQLIDWSGERSCHARVCPRPRSP